MPVTSKTLRDLADLALTGEQFAGMLRIIANDLAADEERSVEDERRRVLDAARTARYRARGGGNIPDDLRRAIYERDEYRCVYCGSDRDLTCDHVVPVSKGGATTLENLATACRPCNSKKKDRDRKTLGRSAELSGPSMEIPRKRRGQSKDGPMTVRLSSADFLGTPPAPSSPKETPPEPPKEITPSTPPTDGAPPSAKPSGDGKKPAGDDDDKPGKSPFSLTDLYDVVDGFNAIAHDVGWPKVTGREPLSKTRRERLRARLKQAGGIVEFLGHVRHASTLNWMCGDNDKGWKANFDFFLQEKSFTKVLERAYDTIKSRSAQERDRPKSTSEGFHGELARFAAEGDGSEGGQAGADAGLPDDGRPDNDNPAQAGDAG